ncbi:hypothetical protein EQP59_09630 [Ornithobacterium rhinotracheale]|uniref:Uncharacterized protein n=1 Tax=Ornithobacterium rhinotracheale TaxID=28251 RepID=A0A3R5XVG6_ORNRH|nr:hypothetical protein [Ornithobacterium rhinotracheale]QAR30440.1 hypothetical protein EQP59_03265 [Ornithobacterium rhinotracheale]QAR30983.1 hypothetical protein EQP59_06340 [Ornithobacterium rhinotracheale]QAR31580.1 hypothetical protein EQP59_09630 [Ornithobacterium rhinotracheale]
MKKILLSFGLCLAVTAGYAQSKEAKKEIRKYYTEKQINEIKNDLKEFLKGDNACLNGDDYDVNRYLLLDYTINFDDKQKEKAFREYFLEPYEKRYSISPDRKMFGYMITNFEYPKDID